MIPPCCRWSDAAKTTTVVHLIGSRVWATSASRDERDFVWSAVTVLLLFVKSGYERYREGLREGRCVE